VRYLHLALPILFVCASNLGAQATATSARAAALQYALAQGLQLDPGNTVVIAESFYMSSHSQTDVRSRAQLTADATIIAKVIGPDVVVANPDKVLSCVRSDCAAAGDRTVVEIDGPDPFESAAPAVLIKVFTPSKDSKASPRGTLTTMAVRLNKVGTNWLAVSTLKAPLVVNVR
jgi:hypothetical protein